MTGDGSSSVADIEAEIAQTRAELADTVDQLTAKLDVKARAADRLHALRDRATDEDGRPTRVTLGAGGAVVGAVVAVVALVLWRRSR